jgi:hypothetical protein
LTPYLLGAVLFALGTSNAFAAEGAKGASEVVFLVQLIVLVVVGRLLGEAM